MICLWVGRKLEEKIVTISNICHKVVVTISDIYCISLSGLGVVVVRAKRRGQTTTMAALAEEEVQLRVGNGECGGGEEVEIRQNSWSRQSGRPLHQIPRLGHDPETLQQDVFCV